MKVKIFAKKLNGKGHVYLDTVDVRDGAWEYRIPVRQPINVVTQPLEVTSNFTDAIRVFRRKKTAFDYVEGEPKYFFEE